MKKITLLLLAGVILLANSSAFAAWVKIKEEAQGTYYLDNASIKCTCSNPDLVFLKVKQIPTFSNASKIIYNIKLNTHAATLYSYASRYNSAGALIREDEMPPLRGRDFAGTGSALDIAVHKACNYCDKYCK